jgi:hypothetical protein
MMDCETGHPELRDTCCARPRVGYPRPSPLRCGLDIRRSLDIICSISQNIQTNAVPRPITTIKNINVNSGAVVMFNIPDAMQAAYQRTQSNNGLDVTNTGAALFIPAAPDQPHTCTGRMRQPYGVSTLRRTM